MEKISNIFAANLKHLRGNRKQNEFATSLGIKPATYSRYESGRIPRIHELERLASVLGTTPNTLIGGTTPNGTSEGHQIIRIANAPKLVPVVSYAAAGKAHSYEDIATQIDEQVASDCKDPNAFGIIIEGSSMVPKFEAGDRVIFAPNDLPRNGDPALIKLKDGAVYFKWYFETGRNGEIVKLVSENKEYEDLMIKREDILFAYPAVEVKRKTRR